MDAAVQDEAIYVHEVYDKIASHFSATRYKPWPLISRFLDNVPPFALGLDAGCGNGKYLHLNSVLEGNGSMLTVGLDYSRNLLNLASQNGRRETLQGDCILLPIRRGLFDFAISIATIHHFSTPHRRAQAIAELISAVDSRNGQVFIQVWALEQGSETMLTKKKDLKSAILSSTEANPQNNQDVFVPWTLQEKCAVKGEEGKVFNRYYHLFKKGELRELTMDAIKLLPLHFPPIHIDIHDEGWERGNWWIWLQIGPSK